MVVCDVYTCFQEAFESEEARTLSIIPEQDLTNFIWPILLPFCNQENMREELSRWKPKHREAFLFAYNAHFPIDQSRPYFANLSFESSFVSSILMYLHH